MAEHDFRYTLLNPQYTLNECRALSPGRYQVTGTGGSIKADDVLLVSLKGSKTLSMRLTVEKVRHLINPPGQWLAVARGPAFRELAIHTWQGRLRPVPGSSRLRVRRGRQSRSQGPGAGRRRTHSRTGLAQPRRQAPVPEMPVGRTPRPTDGL